MLRKDYKQHLLQVLQQAEGFQQFSEPELTEFIEQAQIGFCEQGQRVITQGDSRQEFFVILSGELCALDTKGSSPELLNYLPASSFFGMRPLLYQRPRAATVEAVIDSVVAVFKPDSWAWLTKHHPETITFLQDIEERYARPDIIQFPGRQTDETVVISVKRHVMALISPMLRSCLWLFVPLFFLTLQFLFQDSMVSPLLNSGFFTMLMTVPFVGWTVFSLMFHYLDWRNDDFIVTTKRVIHIERILFYGEERQEAPLTRIQDVTVTAEGFFSSVFDYHDMAISTAGAGIIKLTGIPQAEAIKEALLAERERATARLEAADVASLRHSIARRLDWEEAVEHNVLAVAEAQGISLNQQPTQTLPRLLEYIFPRIRTITSEPRDGITITWRKHYGVWLLTTFWPLLLIMMSSYLLTASLLALPPFSYWTAWPISAIMLIGVIASFTWYVWEYDGWRRDVYVVTPSRIVDVESSAFQTKGETRREGRFDNIQNITYNVPNFISKLFNVGDVVIETAGSQDTFTFNQVYNPSAVHQEIFNRMILHQQRRREQERKAATSHVIDMIGEYHHLYEKVRPHQPQTSLQKAA